MRYQRFFTVAFALVALFTVYASPAFADATSNTCSVAVKPVSTSAVGACDNPIPLGRAVEVGSGGRSFKFAVAEVIRGKKAWERLRSYSTFNMPPSANKEYIMALVVVRYLNGPVDLPQNFNEFGFKVVSNGETAPEADGIVYVRPEFKVVYELNAPGAGWIIAQVDPNDPNPVLELNSQVDKNVSFYFATANKL
jgi:hypothetical protein